MSSSLQDMLLACLLQSNLKPRLLWQWLIKLDPVSFSSSCQVTSKASLIEFVGPLVEHDPCLFAMIADAARQSKRQVHTKLAENIEDVLLDGCLAATNPEERAELDEDDAKDIFFKIIEMYRRLDLTEREIQFSHRFNTELKRWFQTISLPAKAEQSVQTNFGVNSTDHIADIGAQVENKPIASKTGILIAANKVDIHGQMTADQRDHPSTAEKESDNTTHFQSFGSNFDPRLTANYYSRKGLENTIFGLLKKVCAKPELGALAVYAEGGMGKSALISHLLTTARFQRELKTECAIQAAIYVNCNKWRDELFDEKDFSDHLIGLIARGLPDFNNVELDDLGKLPKIIFALDDVYSISLLEYFRKILPQAAVCVITRDFWGMHCRVKQAESIDGGTLVRELYRLPDFSDDELKGALKINYEMGGRLHDSKLKYLAELCHGFPFVLSFIGPRYHLCEDHYEDEYKSIVSDLRELSDQSRVYDFLLRGFEDHSHEFQFRYLTFLLYPLGADIHVDELAILWQVKKKDALSIANEFRYKSLVRNNIPSDPAKVTLHAHFYGSLVKWASGEIEQDKLHEIRQFLLWQLGPNVFKGAIEEGKFRLIELLVYDILRLSKGSPEFVKATLFNFCAPCNPDSPLLSLFRKFKCSPPESDQNLKCLCLIVELLLVYDKDNAVNYLNKDGGILEKLLATVSDNKPLRENALLVSAEICANVLFLVLVENGANLETVDDNGTTSLMVAVLNGNFGLTERLLDGGMVTSDDFVNKKNKNGYSALHLSALRSELLTPLCGLIASSTKCHWRAPRSQAKLKYRCWFAPVNIKKGICRLGKCVVMNDDYSGEQSTGVVDQTVTNSHSDNPIPNGSNSNHLKGIKTVTSNGSIVTYKDLTLLYEAASSAGMSQKVNEATINWDHELLHVLLFWAAEIGNIDAMAKLISAGAKLNDQKEHQITALMIAAMWGTKHAIRNLISLGADVNAPDAFQLSPLMIAAAFGGKETLVEIISACSNVDDRSCFQLTALVIAALFGNSETISELASRDADVNTGKQCQSIALIIAATYDYRDIVSELIASRVDVDGRNELQMTALMTAVHRNKSGVVDVLISKGSNVNARNKYHWTALMIAARFGRKEILGKLISKQATVDTCNQLQMTAMMIAVQYGKRDIAAELISKGANIHARNKYGWTALMIAVRFGHQEIMGDLIKAGANVNARNESGGTPLMIAAKCGSREMVKELIDSKADISACDNYNRSAVVIAYQYNQEEAKDELISNGAETYLLISLLIYHLLFWVVQYLGRKNPHVIGVFLGCWFGILAVAASR